MSERIKSLSEKKIEKSLGISADDLSDLDDNNVESPGDDDKAKIDLKQEQLSQIKEKLDQYKSLNDKEFAREIYRQLALDSIELFQMTKAEMQIDPSPRYVEVASQAANTAKDILNSLRDIENTDKQFEIEDKKLLMRDKAPTNLTQNIAFSGTIQDLMKQIDMAKDVKTIDAKVEIIKDV